MSDRVPDDSALRIRFWGVRGSMGAAGPAFVEFGGHTPCIEVRCGARLFMVDAGTGLAVCGAQPEAQFPARIDVLLSHLHLDHIFGLPFFKPALLREQTIRLHCGNLAGASAEAALGRAFAPPLFPVRLDELPARFEHVGFRSGETLHFAETAVETHPLPHPGGATGYRFTHNGRSACYISDIEHTEPWPALDLVRFTKGADLVMYDGMFSDAEYPRCKGWGHSTWHKGVELCEAAGVKSLAIVHLHPGHDDAALRRMESELQASMPGAFVARERHELVLAPLSSPDR